MERSPTFVIRWYDSLQFRISSVLLVLFLLMIVAVTLVLKTIGQRLVEEQAFLEIGEADHQVIAELEKRTVLSATLADAMANLAEQLPADKALNRQLIAPMMDYGGTEALIAGGGIWPEPFQFDPQLERSSFFWGRDGQGQLVFYDDYNLPEGRGYHHEEWYVPARYLPDGSAYWSKSYTDPYSFQPMVTVTVPMFRDERFIGAATIDLKLEGLQQLLAGATRSFGGYAFAVDRNGTFLSFPDHRLALQPRNPEDPTLRPHISYEELTARIPEFQPYADILSHSMKEVQIRADTRVPRHRELAQRIARESYQVGEEEAKLIAVALADAGREDSGHHYARSNFVLDHDYFLKEAVYASVTTMPGTGWKIVTVMPYSRAIETITGTYDLLMLATLGAVLVAMLIIWLLVRQVLTGPIIRLSRQLQEQVCNDQSPAHMIRATGSGELGALTHWFNQRSRQLLDTQNEIRKLAHFDSLTGLPNRRLLLNRLENKLEVCRRQKCHGALMFIDLDNFKLINDSLGHETGDQLLVLAASRLSQCLRREDTIARLGGDEFVVLIVKNSLLSDELVSDTLTVAEKIVRMMQQPFELKGQPHHISVSIGISVFPRGNDSADELLRQADTAMYRTKSKGRNGFCFFRQEMQEDADKRLQLGEELRQAMPGRQLFLVYQPQVDSSGRCFGAEALLRWNHPQRGLQSPADFIAVAEESGLIVDAGNWVVDEACRQVREWHDRGLDLDEIAVNVSPRQFRHIQFVSSVRQSIERHRISPSQLVLELTESIVIDDIDDTVDKMKLLKSIGVRISIDDFGTGYSSLAYLKTLPLDQLKIDQSFVRDIATDPNDAVIVSTIIAMAQHLGLDVIAEGVENPEQKQFLLERECGYFQGFYFSKPMPAADFERYLRSEQTPGVTRLPRLKLRRGSQS